MGEADAWDYGSERKKRPEDIFIYYLFIIHFLFKHILGSHTGQTVPQGALPWWGLVGLRLREEEEAGGYGVGW